MFIDCTFDINLEVFILKKYKKTVQKTVSLFLAVFMISAVAPFAFAATETLKAANVVSYPTLSYKNEEGKMYYGQSLDEALIINDDEVVNDAAGNQVAGHFEFRKPEYIPTPGTDYKLDIKFIPDDQEAYSTFTKLKSSLIYSVEAVELVPVDENDTIPVATEVESGALLSTSTLSGAKYTNPYNSDEPNVASRTWEWVTPSTVVNESGYYEAMFIPAGYEKIIAQVYVRIAGEIPETTITEVPTVPTLTYDGVTTWGDVTLEGGKAELKIEGTEVNGTFSVTDYWKTRTVNVGSYEIDVVFTPTDPEAALPYSLKIPVTVNKAPIKFVDENGNEIVPEITVEYGTKFYDVVRLLQPYVKGAEYTALSLGDLEYKECEDGTFTVTASAPSDGAHYETTELSFKIVMAKKEINPKLYSTTGKLYIEDQSATYSPTGTFTLEYTIDGVEQTPITGIKYNEHFDWNPTQSGDYEYTIIYNEAEEERYIIDDFTASNAVTLSWGFSATGSLDGEYQYGSEVTLEAPATDPEKADKPYYGFVKWVDANGNTGLSEEDLESREISFTMPDGEVDLDATYEFDFCLMIQYWFSRISAFFNSFFASLGTLF